MDALFEIIKSELTKHKVKNWHTDTVLVKVAPGATKSLNANNDFYFFANAYTNTGIVNGIITGSGSGNALGITPETLAMKIHKFQMFKGALKIDNKASNNTLSVELVRITPIVEIENEK